jgi:hypothetical protein
VETVEESTEVEMVEESTEVEMERGGRRRASEIGEDEGGAAALWCGVSGVRTRGGRGAARPGGSHMCDSTKR